MAGIHIRVRLGCYTERAVILQCIAARIFQGHVRWKTVMDKVVLAADLGGTNLRMAAVAGDGAILHTARTGTPKGVSPEHLIELLGQLANECRSSSGTSAATVGIAVGAPANINAEGVLQNLPNLPTLSGMDLKGELETAFELPATLENDATAAAIGENWLGASRDVNDSIIVTLGTGVGGGIIINNGPVRGIDGAAGKIGHMSVEPEGAPCGCGSRGCVEQYASATAVVRMAREAGMDENSSFDVFKAAKAGDTRAVSVFNAMGRYLGITLAGLLNALNPEMIIIGGGAAEGWDMFIGPLKTEMKERAFDEPFERVEVVRAVLGDNAGILGVARSAFLKI